MKKYKKPVLDIVEFDNMDVIVMSDNMDGDDTSNDSIEDPMQILKNSDDGESGEQASGPDETAGSGVTNQGSEGSTDEPVLSEETPAPPETESDTGEPNTQVEPQPDDDLS